MSSKSSPDTALRVPRSSVANVQVRWLSARLAWTLWRFAASVSGAVPGPRWSRLRVERDAPAPQPCEAARAGCRASVELQVLPSLELLRAMDSLKYALCHSRAFYARFATRGWGRWPSMWPNGRYRPRNVCHGEGISTVTHVLKTARSASLWRPWNSVVVSDLYPLVRPGRSHAGDSCVPAS